MSTSIDVCICTFRRASIEDTIHSISVQKVDPEISIRVIVADNDTEPSAEARINTIAADLNVPVTYVHAPERNISIARNACLDAATGEWVAFIDDDETAKSDWIAQILSHAEENHLDVVFGPVFAQYEADSPNWITEQDYHSSIPESRDGEVQVGIAGNALIRRTAPMIEGQRFLLEKGRTGGEDTEFFHRVWKAGAKMGIAQDAIIFESVDPKRLNFNWIMNRKYRSGISYGLLSASSGSALTKLGAVGRSMAKVSYCGLRALISLPFATTRNFWVLRGVFHCGVAAAAFDQKEQELYGVE